MESLETKEEKLKKKWKENGNFNVDYRVHGGNQINEIITEFKKSKKETLDILIEEFLKSEVKEELNEAELIKLRSFIETELENYFTQIEQEAYEQLRNHIRDRYSSSWYQGGIQKRELVPDHTQGSGIHLLTTDRSSF